MMFCVNFEITKRNWSLKTNSIGAIIFRSIIRLIVITFSVGCYVNFNGVTGFSGGCHSNFRLVLSISIGRDEQIQGGGYILKCPSHFEGYFLPKYVKTIKSLGIFIQISITPSIARLPLQGSLQI